MRSKKALKNIITSLLQQVIVLICGFIIPKTIISNYGSDVNGLVNSITQFLAYITLLESGFGPVVKSALYKPIAKKDKKTIASILKATERFFRKIAYIFIIYIIVLCIIYPLFVNNEFDSIYTISLIAIIGIATFAEYFFGMTYKIYLQAEQKTYIGSTINIITTVLNAVLILVLIKLNVSIHIVKLLSAVIFISRPIVQNIYVKKVYNINLKNNNDKYEIKQKWSGLGQHIAGVIHGNTDVTILTIFSDIKNVSVYSVYNLVVTGIKNIISVFSSSIDSTFGDMIAKEETNNLNNKFCMYEFLYYTIITFIYSCTIILIIPFIKIYTSGISDAEYVRPVFAYLIVIASFIHSIKTPYNTLAFTAGKFKETQKGAWIEAILNLSISLVLVIRFGLVGVAIGTLISVCVRGIEIMLYVSKNILDRKILKTFIRSIISIIELICVIIICNLIIEFKEVSFMAWIFMAMKVAIIAMIIIIPINLLYYKNEIKECKLVMKNFKLGVKK